jgi:hypothetical protein
MIPETHILPFSFTPPIQPLSGTPANVTMKMSLEVSLSQRLEVRWRGTSRS